MLLWYERGSMPISDSERKAERERLRMSSLPLAGSIYPIFNCWLK
jgi:hypothetical protein